MHLSRPVLKEQIEKKGIVSGHGELDAQLTANGVDLRLAALVEVLEGGRIAVDKARNRAPKLGRAFVLKGFESRLDAYKDQLQEIVVLSPSEAVSLVQMRPYFAITQEEVNIPTNMLCDIKSRSTVFRYGPNDLFCTVGEAGYRGYLTFVLLPFLANELELGARFCQVLFSELRGESHYEDQKQASYQGGKLF